MKIFEKRSWTGRIAGRYMITHVAGIWYQVSGSTGSTGNIGNTCNMQQAMAVLYIRYRLQIYGEKMHSVFV